jgi:hypothetical protein
LASTGNSVPSDLIKVTLAIVVFTVKMYLSE